MAGEPSGAVSDFCAALSRLVRDCDVPQTVLAKALHRSNSSVSELLAGKRSTPPSPDDVQVIVETCRARAAAHGRAAKQGQGLVLEPAYWRTRLAELEEIAYERRRRPAPPSAEPEPEPEAPVEPGLAYDFHGAVQVLVPGPPGMELAGEVLEPLHLRGGVTVDLHGMFRGFAARVRAARGTARTALLCAADVVVLVAGFCDAVAGSGIVYGPELGYRQGDVVEEVLAELSRIDLGSARVRDAAELRHEISAAYESAAEIMYGGVGNPYDEEGRRLAARARRRYGKWLGELTLECAELRLTSETDTVPPEEDLPPSGEGGVGLSGLGAVLRQFAGGADPSPRRLRRLAAPIAPADNSGPVIPTLVAGYVNPAFRVAPTVAQGLPLSSDEWWDGLPVRHDIEQFLAAHLITDRAAHAPLMVLGHPGSGKSLLTRLVEAHLPESEFSCLRVELRHVPADIGVQEQLEAELYRSTGRRTDWPDFVAPDVDVLRVVLLDGFDELLQAGAARLDARRQRDYLKSVERFQQREYELGRPTAFIVTSRTVVADRSLTPTASTVIRLEPFDDDRARRWLDLWETANRRYLAGRALRPLTWDLLRPHRELTGQPLLLLMLALYDAVDNPLRGLAGRDIGRSGLYERLLTEFVRRQLVKHHDPLPVPDEAAEIEGELRRLGVIAIGMFNRRGQSITAGEATADLAALLGEDGSPLLFGRFFFVHEARAVVASEEARSYEFLHATFGEYLAVRLIVGELRDLAARGAERDLAEADDGLLRALLSYIPLTDRAEVVRNAAEQLAAVQPQLRARVSAVLRELFGRLRRESGPSSELDYRPEDRNRTERDAAYGANLLLLAVLAGGGVDASEFLDTPQPVDRWWRYAHLWRSQLSEASWEAFSRTLSVDRHDEGHDGGPAEGLRISLRTAPAGEAVDDAAELTRRVSFLCDSDAQQLLDTLEPLLDVLPDALRAPGAGAGGRHPSAARALVALLCKDAGDGERLTARYEDALAVLERTPGEAGSPVADLLARNVIHDAASLPVALVLRIFRELTRPRLAAAGAIREQTWRALLECARIQAGRPGLTRAEATEMTSRALLRGSGPRPG